MTIHKYNLYWYCLRKENKTSESSSSSENEVPEGETSNIPVFKT